LSKLLGLPLLLHVLNVNVSYLLLASVFGHDAFLIDSVVL